MSNKSDKPFAVKTIIGSLLAIAIAYVLLAVFSHQVAGNFKNPVYTIVVVILGLLFVWKSIQAYNLADDTVKDNSSKAYVIALAVIIILWAGGWVAGSNEKKMFEDDVNKAKQTGYNSEMKRAPYYSLGHNSLYDPSCPCADCAGIVCPVINAKAL